MPTQFTAASPGALLQLIRQSNGITRHELLQQTGMSRNTLVSRLESLERAELIRQQGVAESTGGRPRSVLAFDDRHRMVVTIDVGHHRTITSLCRLDGTPVISSLSQRDGESLQEMVTMLADGALAMLGRFPGTRLTGVGVSIPAPVQTATGVRWPSIAMPDPDYPLGETLAERFDSLVCIENDARALALGALAEAGPLSPDGVLLAVKYSTGLGVGIVTNDGVMRGISGAAGDIGHVQITPEHGPVCTCGKRGCLAAYCSGRRLVEELDRSDVRTVTQAARLFEQGDPEAVRLVLAGVHHLALHLAGLIQVCNPQYVVFGGDLGLSEPIVDLLTGEILEHLSERARPHLEFGRVESEHTSSKGLVRLVTDRAFSPELIDATLA